MASPNDAIAKSIGRFAIYTSESEIEASRPPSREPTRPSSLADSTRTPDSP